MTNLKTYNYIYQKYKNTILFNKNLILSGIAAFFAGAIFTQVFAEPIPNNNLLNTLFTLSVEYGVYIPLFAVLFYLDNRHRYINPITGQKDPTQIKNDIKKLFAAFSISEVIYSICKISSQYYLLQRNTEPYQASMLAAEQQLMATSKYGSRLTCPGCRGQDFYIYRNNSIAPVG